MNQRRLRPLIQRCQTGVRGTALVGAVLAAIGLAACGGSGGAAVSAPAVAPARTYTLQGFQPGTAVAPGQPTTVSFKIQQPSGQPLTAYRKCCDPHAGVDLIIVRSDAKETRRRAAAYDPGRRAVWLIVLGGSAVSLFAAVALLGQAHGSPFLRGLHLVLCVATVAISWLVTHSAFTLRYAHLYYRDAERAGGIQLPGDGPLDDFDFAYFAFTIAMCAQVSDATISSPRIRRTALGHALLSFLYNTVILAFTLNLVVGQLG